MNKEDARKNAEVMLAYADGKEIEVKAVNGYGWMQAKDPVFDWVNLDYRVKPQPRYVPFTFEDRELFLGRKVRFNSGIFGNENMVWIITTCEKDYVWMGSSSKGIPYSQLLNEYMFDAGDKCPCGKLEG